ncbi:MULTISPECIES: DUF4290 domain-containing protein [Dokdonia]|uniref:Methionyl-tRNA formyltransferase n=2 Tax=Dokdonia TaxID=326319 RepID=A0A0A2H5A0_9FLAO|nr:MULTISPECIES: DUF4290 domain-containing protein [Dokdonia]KGO07800.1 methionyl-tRNA formyltransferase [Dokdonia donghaensis DSW-1]MDE0597571.1 DUF4290 domain-containing protein [Dokdonia donghaensis]
MIDQLEYNTERVHLIIPEYGRHIQKMVNDATAMEDAEERNKTAKAIIAVMGNLQPHLRDVPDFQHKLWDQLFIMSDFKLDVESPYGKPSREELAERPEPLEYPQNHPKYRFYGNNIKRMIDVAVSWEKGEMREGLAMTIANHMKKCFLNWNKDTVEDDVIFDHLFELSNGEINLKERDEQLRDSDRLIRANKKAKAADNPVKKRNYSKNNNRKKRY